MADRPRALVIGPEDQRGRVAGALDAAGYAVDAAEEASTGAGADAAVVAVVGSGAAAVVDALAGDSALSSMQAKNAELEAFASRASHDLKTPLAVITGTADTLRKAWDRLGEADRAQLLEAMYNQARRAAAMVNDLLAQARDDTPRSDGPGPRAPAPPSRS